MSQISYLGLSLIFMLKNGKIIYIFMKSQPAFDMYPDRDVIFMLKNRKIIYIFMRSLPAFNM